MIAVGGEALIDLVIQPDGSVAAKLGGGPFNAARTIARLGGAAAFLGTLSVDRFGGMLRRQLVDDGVDTSFGATSTLPTTLAAAELDDHGSASYRFYITDTSAPAMSGTVVPTATTALHVGTLGLVLEPMATTLERLVTESNSDTLVFVDPNCRPLIIADRARYLETLARVIRRADVVKISTDDAEYLDPTGSPLGVARSYVALGARLVLLTAGGGAVVAVAEGWEVTVPIPPVEVVDTIGAGDAFGGAFLRWWLANGHGRGDLADRGLVERAVARAVLVSGMTCERAGAEPPFLAELPTDWLH